MARINIDDELHAEKGFKRLVRALGDEDKAVGLLYRYWRLAQDYWGDDCALMPADEFDAEGFAPILTAGLAEKRDTGVYAKGAEERFAWYLQKCRASKAGVRARLDRKDPPDPPTPPAGPPSSPSAGPPEPPSRSTGDAPPVHPTVPVPVPVPVPATVTSSVPASVADPDPARARDTGPDPGPGPGDAYAQGNRDRDPPQGPEPFDFEVPELIACELEARARMAAAPPPEPVPRIVPRPRVVQGPWRAPNISPAAPNICPPGARSPFALPQDGVDPGEEFRKIARGIWGAQYRPPEPVHERQPIPEENSA